MEELRLSPRIRKLLYITAAVATPIVAYLNDIHVLGSKEVLLCSGLVTVAGSLAAYKVNK